MAVADLIVFQKTNQTLITNAIGRWYFNKITTENGIPSPPPPPQIASFEGDKTILEIVFFMFFNKHVYFDRKFSLC